MDRNTGSWLVTVTDCLSHDIIPSLYANAGITGKWQRAHPRSAAIARDVSQILYRSFLEIALRFCFSAHRDWGGRMRLGGGLQTQRQNARFPCDRHPIPIGMSHQPTCHNIPCPASLPVLSCPALVSSDSFLDTSHVLFFPPIVKGMGKVGPALG